MIDALRAREPTRSSRAARGRPLTVTLWVLQIVLAFQFAGAGLLKVIGAPVMVELFDDIGAGQWLRILVGVLEIAGAVGLLIPALSGLAALGLVALMVGATFTNVFVIEQSPLLAVVFLVVSALIAGGRWPQVKALFGRFNDERTNA